MVRTLRFMIILCCLLAAKSVSANSCTTCYIDYLNGNDSWDGTSKVYTSGTTGPWKHLPGMIGTGPTGGSSDGCTGKCAAQVPQAGDRYILKGGVVWPATTMPLTWNWSGASTTTTNFGCAGAGCIYVGIDPTWNKGTINSITTTRDFGGCPLSGVTVSISGGGGSGGAATPNMVGGLASFADTGYMVGWYTITNAGSGYTSNPTVTVSGSGCRQITAVADIQRAIIDFGAPGTTWSQVSNGGIGPIVFNGAYLIVDNLEIRNMSFLNNIGSGYVAMLTLTGNHSTASNDFIHNFYPSGNTTSTESYTGIGDGNVTGEIAYSYVNNAEPSFACGSVLCSWGEFGSTLGVNIHHNHISFGPWATKSQCYTAPCVSEVYNNEVWAGVGQNAGGHLNLFYLGGDGWTLYIYNNIAHDSVGCTSQLTSGDTVGNTAYYIFNNVMWNTGSGGAELEPDLEGGGSPTKSTVYNFWNNTIGGSGGGAYSTEFEQGAVNLGGGQCAANASHTSVTLYNNHAITDQSLAHWFVMNCTISAVNGVISPQNTTADSANVIQSLATANGQGYTIANAFMPTSSSNATVTFTGINLNQSNPGSSTPGLASLAYDINGTQRPATTTWNAGAYYYTGSPRGQSTPPNPPSNLVSAVEQ